MSPYVEVVAAEAQPKAAPEAASRPGGEGEGAPALDEELVRCTECEYTAPRSEFIPENYR